MIYSSLSLSLPISTSFLLLLDLYILLFIFYTHLIQSILSYLSALTATGLVISFTSQYPSPISRLLCSSISLSHISIFYSPNHSSSPFLISFSSRSISPSHHFSIQSQLILHSKSQILQSLQIHILNPPILIQIYPLHVQEETLTIKVKIKVHLQTL